MNPDMGLLEADLGISRRSYPSDIAIPTEGWVPFRSDTPPPPIYLVRVTFKGLRPLLMHNSRAMILQAEWAKRNRTKTPPPDELYCEWASYRDNPKDPHRFITEPFILCLHDVRNVYLKDPNQSRRSPIGNIVRGALTRTDDYAFITRDPEGTQYIIDDFEPYRVPVVVNKSRVMRVRPRIHPPWYITLIFEYRHASLHTNEVWEGLYQAWKHAGTNVGVGDYRPQKKGDHGIFDVYGDLEVVRIR